MRIVEVTDHEIRFDNGNIITYFHDQGCCEENYADFNILNENTVNYDYDFDPDLTFKKVDGEGFLFGNEGHMIFIPCYSDQNGYYSSDIEIIYGKKPLTFECKMIGYDYDEDEEEEEEEDI